MSDLREMFRFLSDDHEGDALEFLVDFADFLNQQGFSVSPAVIERAARLANCAFDGNLEPILKPAFCTNPRQYTVFPNLFHQFIDYRHQKAFNKQSKKELEESRQKSEQEAEKLRRQLEEAKRLEEEEVHAASFKEEAVLPRTKKKFFEDHLSEVASITGDSDAKKLSEGALSLLSERLIEKYERGAVEKAESALKENQVKEFEKFSKLYTNFHAALLAKQKVEKEADKRERAVRDKYQDGYERVQRALDELEAESRKIQNRIDNLLKQGLEAPPALVIKNASLSPREEFIGGCRAVQVIDDALPCLEKNFDHLTTTEKALLENYLKRNIMRFKTKLTRHIDVMNRAQIDILSTIQYACKTGGLPMHIHYQKPKAGKANLLLVLDVSGSCKEASAMLLAFSYFLSSAFPRGCRAYAFVNRLYDISDTLQSTDIDSASKAVLDMIPRHGAYSDYSVPLTQLWEQHRKEITKDTIVIFMGDARNNQNQPMYETLKNICRKAKRAYWLNTERQKLWNKADSIAGGYARYAKMYEVVNTSQLVGFIQEGIR